MTLSERVTELLLRRGFRKRDGSPNVQAAARELGIGYATVHGLVHGTLKNPEMDTLVKLAKGLGTTIDYIVTGLGPPSRAAVQDGDPYTAGRRDMALEVMQLLAPELSGAPELSEEEARVRAEEIAEMLRRRDEEVKTEEGERRAEGE